MGEKILSVYWFAILVIVAGAIFVMAGIFYGSPYDVREIEAHLLSNRVADCLVRQGNLQKEIFDGKSFLLNEQNFLDLCRLNFSSPDFEREQYFVRVEVFGQQEPERKIFELEYGNKNLEADCKIEKEYSRTASCERRVLFGLDKDGKLYKIKILSVVGKIKKNVR